MQFHLERSPYFSDGRRTRAIGMDRGPERVKVTVPGCSNLRYTILTKLNRLYAAALHTIVVVIISF